MQKIPEEEPASAPPSAASLRRSRVRTDRTMWYSCAGAGGAPPRRRPHRLRIIRLTRLRFSQTGALCCVRNPLATAFGRTDPLTTALRAAVPSPCKGRSAGLPVEGTAPRSGVVRGSKGRTIPPVAPMHPPRIHVRAPRPRVRGARTAGRSVKDDFPPRGKKFGGSDRQAAPSSYVHRAARGRPCRVNICQGSKWYPALK